MQIRHRQFCQLARGFAALAGFSSSASAMEYPNRTVCIIVEYPAAAADPDVTCVIVEPLSEQLRQQFVVDDRAGAGSNIGNEIVVKAAPDSYTLWLAVCAAAVNMTLYKNLSFDFIRDIVLVALIGIIPFTLTVLPSFPAKNLSEFIAYVQANPGRGRVNLLSTASEQLEIRI